MTKPENDRNCLLCGTPADSYCSDRSRNYLRCPECDLIFVPPSLHLSHKDEKKRYDYHRNDSNDPGYRKFLSRLFHPLETKLNEGETGLDFGCGPEPTLSVMFEEAGYNCDVYDLHYANDAEVFNRQYDFLTCSETIEHMYRPRKEFERFLKLAKPGGWIGIMTQFHDTAPVPFERWHYKDDDTHVCFFSKKSFRTLGKYYELTPEFHSNGVVLFQAKKNSWTSFDNESCPDVFSQ